MSQPIVVFGVHTKIHSSFIFFLFSPVISGLFVELRCELITVGRIAAEATRSLIAASLDASVDDISDAFMTLIEDKAGGIPLYTRTFAESLRDDDLISRHENGM